MSTRLYTRTPTRSLVSLLVCFAILWVLIVGSVSSPVTFSSFSSSYTLPTKAFADDMMDGEGGMPSPQDAPATTDAITDAPPGRDSDDGDDVNNDDGSNDIPKDAPLTKGTLTTEGDSDNDDDDEDDDSGRDNDDDNDNEPTSKDAPATTDTLTAKKMECSKGEEVSLFSTSCEPIDGGGDGSRSPTDDFPFATSKDAPLTGGALANLINCPKDMEYCLFGEGFYEPHPDEYVPPAAALPYRGNEIELIQSYDKHDIDAVKKYDVNGRYGRFTFNDGTIKEGTYVTSKDWTTDDGKDRTELKDIKITPGPNTPLDSLGVKEAQLPFSGAYPEVHYKDGNTVYTRNLFQNSDGHWGQKITTIDSKGNELGITTINEDDRETYTENPNDGSYSKYKADGSYVTYWPPKADGSQQFYDSKQQKVFVRHADGNIIPPKE